MDPDSESSETDITITMNNSIIHDIPDFSFATNNDRLMLTSAYKTITREKKWDLIKNFKGKSFMFDAGDEIDKLMLIISHDYNDNHSGCSLGLTMRAMECIAKNGYDEFKKSYMKES